LNIEVFRAFLLVFLLIRLVNIYDSFYLQPVVLIWSFW